MRGFAVRGKRCLPLAAVALGAALSVGCTTTTVKRPPQTFQSKSWTEKVADSFKGGTDRLTSSLTSKQTQPGTANTLKPDKEPGPAIYVAWAELQEQGGNIQEAETQLRKALAIDHNHVGALLAYAHLEDRQRNFQAALKYYNRAIRKHSKNATVHNDLGLCYHRHNKLNEAAEELAKAVQLEPDQKLYRDNLAAVLVDQGKGSEALTQLIEAHGQPVGHYNLGYLLVQKHDMPAALAQFRQAAQLDPSFDEARKWIVQLSRPARPPVATASPAPMLAQRQPPRPGYPPNQVAPGGAAAGYPSPANPTANPAGNRYYPPTGAPPNGRPVMPPQNRLY